MKKLSYLFVSLFLVAAMVSCEQDEVLVSLKKAPVPEVISQVSNSGIAPVIIAGENNGGNRTCAEVGLAFKNDEGYFDLCGEKIDFSGSFAGEFPDGLTVNVTDGKYVSFEMKDCIEIEGRLYKVGAVIVKGSNDANIYFYPDGILKDGNLSSPINNSGKPAGLSNLSFCFVECEQPELVIALKTYIAEPLSGEVPSYARTGWAVSGGLGVDPAYGLHMGYNLYSYTGNNEFELIRATLQAIIGKIGTIKARDYWEGPVHYLEVIIDAEDPGLFIDKSFLYVGSLAGYTGRYFESFPFIKDEISDLRVYKIDFKDIHF